MTRALVAAILLCLHIISLHAQWNGEMRPVHPGGDYVLLGQLLQLECTVDNSSSLNASHLFIEKGDDFNGTLTIVNDWTVQMNDIVQFLNYSGEYFCFLDNNQLVDSVKVEVEYPPEPPVNLSCVYFNWDEQLTCTWELGVQYVNTDNIDVSFLYLPHGQRSPSMCLNQTMTMCRWDFFFYTGLQIILMVNNTRANVLKKTGPQRVDMEDIVKPARVIIKDIQTTANSITVSWSHDKVFRPKVYRLQLQDLVKKTWVEHMIPSMLQAGEREAPSLNLTIHNLTPYTQYRLHMDVRPGLDSGYWSESVTQPVTTDQDVPSVGPIVTAGMFYQQPCGAGNMRDVTVYWQEPESENQNGVITGYELHWDGIRVRLNATTFHYELPALPCDNSTAVELYAWTVAGPSQNFSQIVISAQAQDDRIIDYFYVLLLDNEFKAEWNVFTQYQGEITHVHIAWCVGIKVLNSCNGLLQWMSVSSNQTEASLPVPLLDIGKLLFAISVEVNGTSSGLLWASCVVENIAPQRPPSGLQVVKTSQKSSLRVKWENRRCLDSDHALITEYNVFVAKVTNGKVGERRNYTYNLTQSEHDENDLKGNYSFQLQAVSPYGKSPLSAPIYMNIAPDSAQDDRTIILLLVFMTVFVCLLLALVIYCKMDCIKEKLTKKYDIAVPQISPTTSPSHEPLQESTTSCSSSLEGGTLKSGNTEEYMVTTSAGTSLTSCPGDISDNVHPIILQPDDVDTIQVIIAEDAAPAQGRSQSAKVNDRVDMAGKEDYSLFAERPTEVQHPDYAPPDMMVPRGTDDVQRNRSDTDTSESTTGENYSKFTDNSHIVPHNEKNDKGLCNSNFMEMQTQNEDNQGLKSSENDAVIQNPDYTTMPAPSSHALKSHPGLESGILLHPGGFIPANIMASGTLSEESDKSEATHASNSEPMSMSSSGSRSDVELGSSLGSSESMPAYVKTGFAQVNPAVLNVEPTVVTNMKSQYHSQYINPNEIPNMNTSTTKL